MKLHLACVLTLGALCASCGTRQTDHAPGRVLRGEFIYEQNLLKSALTKDSCKSSGGRAAGVLAAIATDIAATLAGKAIEGAVDYAVAKTKAEATTLEEVVPIEAIFMDSGFLAQDACLVIHNGEIGTAAGATLLGVFQLTASPDRTAFRFDVRDWKFSRFVNDRSSHWGQRSSVRDFAIKVEFFLPGATVSESRTAGWERVVPAASLDTVKGLFYVNQKLPWMPMPPLPTQSAGATRPLNIKVTLVETTAPHQLATWLQESVAAKKPELSGVLQGSVRRALDPGYAAEEDLKSSGAASVAYDSYKAAWDSAFALAAKKPTLKGATSVADQASLATWTAQMIASRAALDAKRIAAEIAFSRAGLPWPGILPDPFV